MDILEQKIRSLALDKGLGRIAILKELPEATEWKVRTVLKKMREEGDLDAVTLSPTLGRAIIRHADVVKDLRPINVTLPKNPLPEVKPAGDAVTFAIFGDVHIPFHDPRAIDVMIQILQYQRVQGLDFIACLGDSADFYAVSDYDKNPLRLNQLQDELVVHAEVMGQITEALWDVARKYTPGNHEDRLRRYIHKNAPALASMPQLQLPSVLGLESLEWEFFGQHILVENNFLITHGAFVAGESAYTASKELKVSGISGASGHVHRLGLHERTQVIHRLRGEAPSLWIETGCLCKVDKQSNADRTSSKALASNWQQGFVIVSIKDGLVQPTLVRIHEGRAIYQGKVFEAR